MITDFPTLYTLQLVRGALPAGCRRILEIGCGNGLLAHALADLNYELIAVDADPAAVEAARQRGVDARLASWPDFAESGFDAVLFTRSLHHIHPLPDAVDRAWHALATGGRLIIEDFDCNGVDADMLAWFTALTRMFHAAGLLGDGDSWLTELADAGDAAQVWQANHDHGLHAFDEIESAVNKIFASAVQSDAAYYFRYLSEAVTDAVRRPRIDEAVAEMELSLAAVGRTRPLGRRLVATKTC